MQYGQDVQAKDKARLALVENIVQAQENERKSISRELHDHLGQSLLALLLQVQSGRDSHGLSDAFIKPIEKTVRQLIDEVRRLAGGMRPSILDDYGLDSALGRHVEEVAQRSGLDIDYEFTCLPGLQRLPLGVEVPLFRIVQEALANVVRHANAAHASVIVLRQLREVTLLIEDDGQGFDTAIVREKGDRRIGLIGMQERVALLGGDFLIQSVPRNGTTIRVRVPLSEDSDAHTNSDRG
jgi:signal transduction histidine kinase